MSPLTNFGNAVTVSFFSIFRFVCSPYQTMLIPHHLTNAKQENEKSKLIDDGIAIWPTMNFLKITIVRRQKSF